MDELLCGHLGVSDSHGTMMRLTNSSKLSSTRSPGEPGELTQWPQVRPLLHTVFLRKILDFREGTSHARRRQLGASSGGSSEATFKTSFPLHNTEARQNQGNLDVILDVVLSCCCRPSTGADS